MCGSGGGGVDGIGGGGGGGVDGTIGSSGVGDSGENIERIVCKSGEGGGSIVYRSGGGGLYKSGWYYGVGWSFCGGGGWRSETGGGMCCEGSPVVWKWERIFFVSFSSDVSWNEWTKCQWHVAL